MKKLLSILLSTSMICMSCAKITFAKNKTSDEFVSNHSFHNTSTDCSPNFSLGNDRKTKILLEDTSESNAPIDNVLVASKSNTGCSNLSSCTASNEDIQVDISKIQILKGIGKYLFNVVVNDIYSFIKFYPFLKLSQILVFLFWYMPGSKIYEKTGIDFLDKCSQFFAKHNNWATVLKYMYVIIPSILASFLYKQIHSK